MKESIKNLILIFSSMLFLFSLIYSFTRPKVQENYQFHVYLRNTFDDNGYNGLKQGMEQAANDLKVELSFGVMEEDALQQKVSLEQEREAGIQGFIFEPKQGGAVLDKEVLAPYVYVNQQAPVNHVPVISADNYKNGSILGTEMLARQSSEGRILIVRPKALFSENAENYAGLTAIFEEGNLAFDEWILEDGQTDALVAHLLAQETYTGVVALSLEVSEVLGKLKKQEAGLANKSLYGFGLSNRVCFKA